MTTNQQNTPMGGGTPSSAAYGSDYMVEVLRALGVKYIALNPGASYRGLHDSIVNFGSGGPEMVLCTHEEIAVALANGYFRVTGEPIATGLHNVVGLQHASMAIFNAWCDRSAILNLGGGGPQDATQRRSTDWVHTALVQGNAVRDYVKYDDQPYSVEAVPESLLRAMRTAMTDPKGPVYICFDSGVQEQRIDSPLPVPDAALFGPPAPPAPNPVALSEAVDLLANAVWPVIVTGEIGQEPVGVGLGGRAGGDARPVPSLTTTGVSVSRTRIRSTSRVSVPARLPTRTPCLHSTCRASAFHWGRPFVSAARWSWRYRKARRSST